MKLTFIDSGVLIAAVRRTDEVARRAMEVLDDPDRAFASSVFVRLEVLPKALYNNSRVEAEFYEAFFAVEVDFPLVLEPSKRWRSEPHRTASS